MSFTGTDWSALTALVVVVGCILWVEIRDAVRGV